MIKVLEARNQRGWDCLDHLLDDSRIETLVGREYKTLTGMTKAADKLAESFATVIYLHEGIKYKYDGSPSIPGRHRARIQEV